MVRLSIGVVIISVCLFLTPEARVLRPDIVGGLPVNITEVPYQIALYRYGDFRCGASLFNELWVLTAAHCVENPSLQPRDVTVRGGSSNKFEGGVIRTAESVTLHPKYNPISLSHDIALIKLTAPLIGENIRPIELIDESYDLKNSDPSAVSGWGRMDNGSLPDILLKVDNLPILLHKECEPVYGEPIYDNMVCAGAPGRDSCNG